MSSITTCIYPRITWQKGEKKLWNPIHRKALKNLPEERVRLRTIEYLLQSGWSKHRISTEEAIEGIAQKELRTDIIGYSQQFEPRLLVECKAEHIPISAKTAEQVARYNQKVNAPYVLMTNGITDYWYAIKDGRQIVPLEDSPKELNLNFESRNYYFTDWKERGFAGGQASPDLRKWLEKLLPAFWLSDDKALIRYLNFKQSPADVDLSHYYHIRTISEDRRIAITTLSTAYGGNRLIGILNENGKNRAVLEINSELVFSGKEGNSSIYSESGAQTFTLNEYWDLSQSKTPGNLFNKIASIFEQFLD
jgi:hypothetical protein